MQDAEGHQTTQEVTLMGKLAQEKRKQSCICTTYSFANLCHLNSYHVMAMAVSQLWTRLNVAIEMDAKERK